MRHGELLCPLLPFRQVNSWGEYFAKRGLFRDHPFLSILAPGLLGQRERAAVQCRHAVFILGNMGQVKLKDFVLAGIEKISVVQLGEPQSKRGLQQKDAGAGQRVLRWMPGRFFHFSELLLP